MAFYYHRDRQKIVFHKFLRDSVHICSDYISDESISFKSVSMPTEQMQRISHRQPKQSSKWIFREEKNYKNEEYQKRIAYLLFELKANTVMHNEKMPAYTAVCGEEIERNSTKRNGFLFSVLHDDSLGKKTVAHMHTKRELKIERNANEKACKWN